MAKGFGLEMDMGVRIRGKKLNDHQLLLHPRYGIIKLYVVFRENHKACKFSHKFEQKAMPTKEFDSVSK